MKFKALSKSIHRGFMTSFLVVLSLGLIIGCTNSSKSNSSSAPGSTGQKSTEIVNLRYMLWDQNQKVGFQKSIDEFEKLNPNIKVTIEQYPWDQYWQKLLTQLAGGTAPDVFTNQLAYFSQFVKKDQIMDITDLVKQSGLDLSIYYPQLLEQYKYQGKLFGLPKDWDTIALMYNKDLFTANGLPEPKDLTWNTQDGGSFLKLSQDLTLDTNKKHPGEVGFDSKKTNQFGFMSYNVDNSFYWNFIAMNGGQIIDKPFGTKLLLDSPESIGALQFLVDMVYKYHVSPPGSSTQNSDAVNNLFASGKVAMMTDGSWNLITHFTNAKFKLGVAPLPTGPKGRISVMNGLADAIYKDTKHPKEAWELVKWLAGEKSQEIMASGGYVWPGIKSKAPLFVDFWKSKGLDVQAFLDEANGQTIGYPITDKWNQAGTEVFNEFNLLWLGNITADEAAKTATKNANAALNAQ
jgi:multiple sugar transport system substrate-binding protein